MVFNSVQYALFLPTVLGLYWLLKRREQNLLLLAASYAFYAFWDYRFLGLMWISTGTDFVVGRILDSTDDPKRRKRIFLASLVVNLGILGFFKYFGFFVDSAVDLLQAFGFEGNRPTLEILLPVGISFYTFHGISYTFDVHRRDLPACRSLIDFGCFVAYFPQLVAGPIGRAHVQLPQFENERRAPGYDEIRSALFLILLGLFKKIAVADALAPFVDQTFSGAGTASATQLVLGSYAFALQIYGDFSGYSDIARGSSRLFGIELLRNFEQPYLSRNMTAFWRTWHISLSTWLRDYLYVPLGGNRRSELATYRNLILTMVLGGLWHGAAWTFVVWGLLHGVFLAVHRRFSSRPGHSRDDQFRDGTVARPVRWRDVPSIVVTFHAVCFAWIFFRANSFAQAFDYILGLLTMRGGPVPSDLVVLVFGLGAAAFLIDLAQRNFQNETVVITWAPVARGLVYAALSLGIVVFSGGTPVPFIYFQF
jgi:D-alanyl-lipoteichoic acid acyltransferase DltB (MBOAT superfamily)